MTKRKTARKKSIDYVFIIFLVWFLGSVTFYLKLINNIRLKIMLDVLLVLVVLNKKLNFIGEYIKKIVKKIIIMKKLPTILFVVLLLLILFAWNYICCSWTSRIIFVVIGVLVLVGVYFIFRSDDKLTKINTNYFNLLFLFIGIITILAVSPVIYPKIKQEVIQDHYGLLTAKDNLIAKEIKITLISPFFPLNDFPIEQFRPCSKLAGSREIKKIENQVKAIYTDYIGITNNQICSKNMDGWSNGDITFNVEVFLNKSHSILLSPHYLSGFSQEQNYFKEINKTCNISSYQFDLSNNEEYPLKIEEGYIFYLTISNDSIAYKQYSDFFSNQDFIYYGILDITNDVATLLANPRNNIYDGYPINWFFVTDNTNLKYKFLIPQLISINAYNKKRFIVFVSNEGECLSFYFNKKYNIG